MNIYVSDVMETFKRAKEFRCEIFEEPIKKENDTDKRGSFYDLAKNY